MADEVLTQSLVDLIPNDVKKYLTDGDFAKVYEELAPYNHPSPEAVERSNERLRQLVETESVSEPIQVLTIKGATHPYSDFSTWLLVHPEVHHLPRPERRRAWKGR